MERTSGLKECPGCGLRNRQGATQCDFCGWDFKEASDDWMGKVSDLEKLGKEASSTEMDRLTRSKIEMTITKPAEAVPRNTLPAEPIEPAHEPVMAPPEDQRDIVVQAEPVVAPAAEVEVTPAIDEPAAVEPAVSEPASPAVVEPVAGEMQAPVVAVPVPSEVMTEAAPKVTAVPETTSEATEKVASTADSFTVTFAMLGTGLALYVLDLFLTTSHAIDKVAGWGIIIFASALIALAVMKLLPKLSSKTEDEDEVFLCPVCHEVVERTEPSCPSCGAKFLEAPAGE